MERRKLCSFSTMCSEHALSSRASERSERVEGSTDPLDSSTTPRLRRGSARNDSGFTFIEILMTLTVIALLFVPVMQLFSNSLYATGENLDRITAMNLAQSEMERTINLNMTKSEIKKTGTQIFPPLEEKP